MVVQIILTTQGKVYLRILGLRRSFFYELAEASNFQPCSPPPPGDIALAKMEQRTF